MRIIYCLRWQKKSLLIIVSQKESVLLYYEMIIDLYEAVLLLGNMIDEQRGWYLKSISINITSIHVHRQQTAFSQPVPWHSPHCHHLRQELGGHPYHHHRHHLHRHQYLVQA